MQSENEYDFTSNKRQILNSKMDIRNKNFKEVILVEYLLFSHGNLVSLPMALLPRLYL